MTILLYKDGRLVIDDGNPIEGNSLEGLVACVADPQSGDTLKFDGKQWVAGAAASGLPAVSGDDNGKVLTVVDGAWAPAAGGGGGTFAVTYLYSSNHTDKTFQEVYDAFTSGKIVYLILGLEDTAYQYVLLTGIYYSQGDGYYNIYVDFNGNSMIADTPNDYLRYAE